jgi:hypothetical protein
MIIILSLANLFLYYFLPPITIPTTITTITMTMINITISMIFLRRAAVLKLKKRNSISINN